MLSTCLLQGNTWISWPEFKCTSTIHLKKFCYHVRNSLIYFQLSPIVHACLSPGDGQEWPKTHVCLTPKFLPEVMEICFGSGNIFKPLTAFITHSTLFWVGQGEAVRGNRREWRKWTEKERERERHTVEMENDSLIWFDLRMNGFWVSIFADGERKHGGRWMEVEEVGKERRAVMCSSLNTGSMRRSGALAIPT